MQGGDFVGGATPALANFLRKTTKSIQDPLSGRPLFEAWASRFDGGVPAVETIVGATDYTAFQEYLGLSYIDMFFDGPYGVYHSMYDNYFRRARSSIATSGSAQDCRGSGAFWPGDSPTRRCCRCAIRTMRGPPWVTSNPSRSMPGTRPR